MRCRAKKRVRKARGAPVSGIPASRATRRTRFLAATSQGRERFGPRSWQMSALLGLTMGPPLSRPRALNQAQIALRRIREIKSDRLLDSAVQPRPHPMKILIAVDGSAHALATIEALLKR